MNRTQQLKAAKSELRAIGVTIRYQSDLREYRVNLVGGTEATAYYTDDLVDATLTGRHMASHARANRVVADYLANSLAIYR
jgi:hypothetical protein